ncbi:MAG: SprT family zinc-dependent metalloprotease [Chlorobiaceae bacterium]
MFDPFSRLKNAPPDPQVPPTPSVPYTLRVSHRAKCARLKMTPHGGLEVVVPRGYDKRQIPLLLLHHDAWIKKTAARFEAERPEPQPCRENGLPQLIAFPHFKEEWRVEYVHAGSGEVRLDEGAAAILRVSGDIDDAALCQSLLSTWLKKRAKSLLVPSLESVAAAHGFRFTSAGVRLQNSRWGSCSSRRSIILNAKLLFLPDYLVRYIMVHELCHTVHMNHSRAFWSLVRLHDPLWRSNDREMKTAWKYVPAWVAARTPVAP